MSDAEEKTSTHSKGEEAVLLPLPDGLKPPDHQIAGHYYGKGKTKLGLLQCQDGTLVKPCQCSQRGEREMNFYQKVFDPSVTNSAILQLREFMPLYLGMWSTELHQNVKYIKLEDITTKMHLPCVLDVKIGRISYDPEATPEKIQKEISKYPPLQKVGFRIPGMRVYNPEKAEFVKTEHRRLLSYTAEQLLTCGFTSYFKSISSLSKIACMSFLRRLHRLHNWFRMQKEFAFYASSLLFVYEGDKEKYSHPNCDACSIAVKTIVELYEDFDFLKLNNEGNNHTANATIVYNTTNGQRNHGKEVLLLLETPCESCDSKTDVRMIDFAHVFPSTDIDHNYLYGLNSLISYLLNFLVL